jgi:hypothetical protein
MQKIETTETFIRFNYPVAFCKKLNVTGTVVPVLDQMPCHQDLGFMGVGTVVELHEFFTSALERGERSALLFGHFNAGEITIV